MKSILIAFLLMGVAASAHASELQDFCDNDPTGELYSEIWDSIIEDGFDSIGLNPESYTQLIKEHEDMSLFQLARKTKESHPEISNALRIWKLETCIDRGYDMLTGKL